MSLGSHRYTKVRHRCAKNSTICFGGEGFGSRGVGGLGNIWITGWFGPIRIIRTHCQRIPTQRKPRKNRLQIGNRGCPTRRKTLLQHKAQISLVYWLGDVILPRSLRLELLKPDQGWREFVCMPKEEQSFCKKGWETTLHPRVWHKQNSGNQWRKDWVDSPHVALIYWSNVKIWLIEREREPNSSSSVIRWKFKGFSWEWSYHGAFSRPRAISQKPFDFSLWTAD